MAAKRSRAAAPQPVSLDGLRQFHENERQWAARREFLARHIQAYPGRKLDQLIALSVVWSNIVFIGNRYGEQLTQKVHQMAEGIDIGEMPSFELVPTASKRPAPPDTDGQPKNKKFGPRPRFTPVHFVASTVEDDKQFQKTDKKRNGTSSEEKNDSSVQPKAEKCSEMEMNSSPYVYDANVGEDQRKSDCSNFMTKVEQDYAAKFESHCSSLSKDFCSNVLDTWEEKNSQGRKGFGYVKPPGKTGRKHIRFGKETASGPLAESSFIEQLSASVKKNMQMVHGSKHINYTSILSQSVQACKANPKYLYVPVKEIPPGDLPEGKIPSNGFACEVRCQDIYLATGFSLSRIGARNKAAERAIQLLLLPRVTVTSVQRKCGQDYSEDTVACSSDSPQTEFPPALKGYKSMNEGIEGSDSIGASDKSWAEFLLVENACTAIGILSNSAAFNKMSIDYKFDLMPPNNTWRCSVYVQDHCVAEAYGNKKTSKHAAAEKAVSILKSLHPNQQKSNVPKSTSSGGITSLKDIVICENDTSAICCLNATAQFNKVPVEYVFERMSDLNWKCQVLIEQELVAEAIGAKKTVKQEAAEAALTVLKKTQPVIINNLKHGPAEDAISRNQIQGLSNNESNASKIKEDNIGNQLLRKMGWTGGGLGKEGEGIAEPIAVQKKFCRAGIGAKVVKKKITRSDVTKMISDYAVSGSQDNLEFSSELNNEERKHIHEVARRHGLKSKSYGKGEGRFLVVSRKMDRSDLIRQLQQGGQVGNYTVVLPDQ